MPKKAIIIGAGIAGIAASIRLRKLGYDVQVFENNSYPGGKLSEFSLGNYRFDAGPSLFTMPHFVDELFYLHDKNPREYYDYTKKNIVCRYFFSNGKKFTAFGNLEDYIEEVKCVFPKDVEAVKRYFYSSKKKYDLTAPLFLENSLHVWKNYFSFQTIKAIFQLYQLDIFKTLNDVNKGYFSSPELVQLFNRYATYNGSNPYQTPGIMGMIPHLEQYFGTFIPKKGMYAITQSLYQLAKEVGVQFYFSSFVEKITVLNGKAIGVEVNRERIPAEVVVSNMDVVPTYRKLMPDQPAPEKTLAQERSSSALIFYWGIKKQFPELDLHNILFSANYQEEFDYIFSKKQAYHDPTIYINITSKDVKGDAPEGCENWFVMINVPSSREIDWNDFKQKSREFILKKINNFLQIEIEPLIEVEDFLTPEGIEHKTQSYLGALYGAASNNRMAAFLRHPNFSQKIKNLYFCGGSYHPGGGIPLCLLSAKIAIDCIKKAGEVISPAFYRTRNKLRLFT